MEFSNIYKGYWYDRDKGGVNMNQIETAFFTIHMLCEGVFEVIAKPGKGAWSNAGIIDLGGKTLIFDTMSTPSAGYELRKHAERLTGNKKMEVMNSHFHGDHMFGNQAFEGFPIYSTALTKQWIKEKNDVEDLDLEREEMEAYLHGIEQRIAQEADPVLIESLKLQMGEMTHILHDISRLKLFLPDRIFDTEHVFKGSHREAIICCHGGGHSPSDSYLYLPQDSVLFAGDLITRKLHVPIYDPVSYLALIKEIVDLKVKTYVPGHGDSGGRELLDTMKTYLTMLLERAQRAHDRGIPMETFVKDFVLPPEYAEWLGIHGIQGNLRKVYEFTSIIRTEMNP
ncbi:MBL fold metallo-hydrolase [Rossellomorea marisflavi]|uniref:MBL fold metallo-hydrolase n=2 Tax=Rossellomorea marisflavi TaxID=189381 RepID=A0A5D4RJW8_9BACI|nr:MBL fold metallo-hydrolase [Rossellomorea marisflavi]